MGCIPPSRSTCTSTTFAQLNQRVVLLLGTRFGASTWGTNLLPDRAQIDRPGYPINAIRSRSCGPRPPTGSWKASPVTSPRRTIADRHKVRPVLAY